MKCHSDGTLSVWKTNHLLIFAVEEYKSFSEQNWNNSLLPHFWNSYVFLFPLSKRLPSYLGSFPRCLSFSVLLRTSFWEQGGSRADPAGDLQLSELLNLLSPAFLVSRAGEIIHTRVAVWGLNHEYAWSLPEGVRKVVSGSHHFQVAASAIVGNTVLVWVWPSAVVGTLAWAVLGGNGHCSETELHV